MDGFYYKGLNREEKSAYEQMLAGFKSAAGAGKTGGGLPAVKAGYTAAVSCDGV